MTARSTSNALLLALLAAACSMHASAQSPPGDVARVSLGIAVTPGSTCDAPKGLCITGVRPGGLADRAGAKAGDVLLTIDGATVDDLADLQTALGRAKPGQRTSLSLRRNRETLTVSAEPSPSDDQHASTPAMSEAPVKPALAFTIVEPTDVESLRARVASTDNSIELDHDVLSIVHRDTRDTVVVGGSLQLPMTRIQGTDIWHLLLQRPDWERAFFSYTFASTRATRLESAPMLEFRGARAPVIPRAVELRGRLETRTIRSKQLNEDRAVSIYLPPGRHKELPVLVMVDGSTTERFARVVDQLVANRIIKPIAIIGVHESHAAGSRPGIDRRSEEYVAFIAPDISSRHLRFFIEEVLPSITHDFGLSNRRIDRALFGFSNGAAFVSTVAVRHSDLFAHVLPFSFNLPKIEASRKPAAYHFAAGELEPMFLATTRAAHEQLRATGVSTVLRTYMSGHDPLLWELALSEVLPTIFAE
jgi:enterochelin esterase-like enzyme